MAVSLPNGVTISLGTTVEAAKTVTAATNANPALITSTSHGLSDNDIVIFTSGWVRANERVFKVDQQSVDTMLLLGLDTTDTNLFPAGTGTGTIEEVSAWTQITQVIDLSTSGGDMQFATYSFLESDTEVQIPTQASPMTMTMSIADDPSLSGYAAVKAAAETRDPYALKLAMPDGSVIYFFGYVSFNETPVLTKNQVSTVRATFNMLNKPVRYS